jgi:hypothetical protein
VRVDTRFLAHHFKQLCCARASRSLVGRAAATVSVPIVRQDMRKRELAISRRQMSGQCDRIATALVLINADDDLLEHLDASWPSR